MQQTPLVLLVEDDSEARDGYAEFLELGGFEVAQAGSAEDALCLCGERLPDVVITDIALPGRDGFALASDLRCEARTRGIPVLAMTAYWATDVHDRAERAGISAVLRKPCQPEHLIAELQRVLQRSRFPRLAQPASVAIAYGRARFADTKLPH